MLLKKIHGIVVLLGYSLSASTADACPFCQSETADKVWAGIFDDDFGYHLFASLAPFPVLMGILLFIYYGPPIAIDKLLRMSPPSELEHPYEEATEKHE